MMEYDPGQFAEKYHLAVEAAQQSQPQGGLCGLELEWNLLDSRLRPLTTVGSGPSQQSFVDYLRSDVLSKWASGFSQLEVFHWMIEWATRPYFSPRGAVYEGRLVEGVLLNALEKAGRSFNDELYAWHGNLLYNTQVGHDTIPGSWHIAKRRYLQRCVDLYGNALATAGTHSNISLPDPLLAWDFMHLPATERGDVQLDRYKSEFYITATRLIRAFAALFIATSASTPLQAQVRDGRPVVVITNIDSVRNLTYPNPAAIDLPDLYRSYDDYLTISYDLVRRGVRFGNNNWTPARARSFAEPVEHLIAITSDQLQQLYARGLYGLGRTQSSEEMAAEIEIQNLLARINIPMSRVEIRTDDGGHTLDVEVANLTMKHLLLLRFYADDEFGRAFRYDNEDLKRARRNETTAAIQGMQAEIEHPLTAKPTTMREFLKWALEELHPLANELDLWDDLYPLVEMAKGAPNAAEQMRKRLCVDLGECDEVPVEVLRALADERKQQVIEDVEYISATHKSLGADSQRLGEFLQRARDDVHPEPQAPVRFRPQLDAFIDIGYADKTSEIIYLAKEMIQIPSVTACPQERLDEVKRAATLIYDYVRGFGLGVRYYHQYKYPALLIGFPGQMHAPVMLSGHFDVVEPDPDDSQFEPQIEGDYLLGRGSADMKTVVATYLVWMKDMLLKGEAYPPINLLLIGNEENGEIEAMGTPQLLRLMVEEDDYQPQLLIAGERTGEKGVERWGQVCTQNRGLMRFEVTARGQRGHTGVRGIQSDLTERLLMARAGLSGILGKYLTLSSEDGWHSQVKFPYIQAGTPGIYNISADYGVVGVEVRPIPQDDLTGLSIELEEYCRSQSLELAISVMEQGIICDAKNPYLTSLIDGLRLESGKEPQIARKLPGTSARFAPNGQGVVWGQSGIGPHSADERHYIPSIEPYYQALGRFAEILSTGNFK